MVIFIVFDISIVMVNVNAMVIVKVIVIVQCSSAAKQKIIDQSRYHGQSPPNISKPILVKTMMVHISV